ncbi:MAG: D-alanine--D-alanine ligase [Azospirillaceae bacterium]
MARRVAVLMGGWSAEREVSLVSGKAAADALRGVGFEVSEIDVRRDVPWLIDQLTPRPDVVFNALHGRGGEDGTIQALLDLLDLPYTHSGVTASALAMNKPLTKKLLGAVGVRSAEGIVVDLASAARSHVMDPPYVVKPAAEGSSIGIRLVREGDNQPPIDIAKWDYGDDVLVERYVPGRELTVGVMGDRALTVTEIEHTHSFFDYEAKYVAGHARHVIPAEVPAAVFDLVMEQALLAHRTLGCRGISRSDFRWDDSRPGTEGVHFLELNTQPGFTPISLVPEQAGHLGIGFAELCAWLVEDARCHH